MAIKYEKEVKVKVNGSYVRGELRSKEESPYFFYPNWETMSARMDGPLSSNHLQCLIEELQELKDNIDASKVASILIE